MARVDATVSDLQGVPFTGLSAADFTIEADGKQQAIESCDIAPASRCASPLSLDDLSLSAARLDKARRALREVYRKATSPGDEAAILRTSSGAGALDRFTSDQARARRGDHVA